MPRWFAHGWVTEALWNDPPALADVLKSFAPEESDPNTVRLDGFNVEARDPELGIKLFVTGFAELLPTRIH